jgi:hypothetical protein
MSNYFPGVGGSYVVDQKTGELVLVPGSRTEPAVFVPKPVENALAQDIPVAEFENQQE